MQTIWEKSANSLGKPKLLLLGDDDVFCSVGKFRHFVALLPEPKKAVVLPNVDHFSMYPYLKRELIKWVGEAFNMDLHTFAQRGSKKDDRVPSPRTTKAPSVVVSCETMSES
eukprot:SAG31_NODE_1850_length_7082_cov_7.264786_1_plen_112_part_00